MTNCYLASPLGFSEAGNLFMKEKLVPLLRDIGLDVLNPWEQDVGKQIRTANTIADHKSRVSALKSINQTVAKHNQDMIDESDIMVAVLDGVDVDSGTAAEIGYAYAKGKPVYGYRGDFRLSCDNIGCKVNLQVEYFCKDIVFDLESLNKLVRNSIDLS